MQFVGLLISFQLIRIVKLAFEVVNIICLKRTQQNEISTTEAEAPPQFQHCKTIIVDQRARVDAVQPMKIREPLGESEATSRFDEYLRF